MRRSAGQLGWAARLGAVAALLLGCLPVSPVAAQVIMKEDPEGLKGVDLVQKLGASVPLNTPIVDSAGQTVELGKYFSQGKPVVLAMVYYDCPMICPLLLSRLQERINGVNYTLGEDFNVVVISFDPTNTTEMAASNKAAYLLGYNKKVTPAVEAGWSFHTASTGSARTIADAIGFKYRYIQESGQYSHPSVLTVLTPEGKVSRYLSGLDVNPGELRLALLEASEGKIAKTIADFFLHRCYVYNPSTGAYTMQAMRVMQMGGLATGLTLTVLIVGLKAGERLRAHRRAAAAAHTEGSGRPQVGRGPVMGHTP